jgi:hypothetical protein
VFVLVLVVPALLVVVVGYVVGYALWTELAGPDGAEVAGWLVGLLLLVISVRVTVGLWRARRRR